MYFLSPAVFRSHINLWLFSSPFSHTTHTRPNVCRENSSAAATARSELRPNVTERIWSSPRAKRISQKLGIASGTTTASITTTWPRLCWRCSLCRRLRDGRTFSTSPSTPMRRITAQFTISDQLSLPITSYTSSSLHSSWSTSSLVSSLSRSKTRANRNTKIAISTRIRGTASSLHLKRNPFGGESTNL